MVYYIGIFLLMVYLAVEKSFYFDPRYENQRLKYSIILTPFKNKNLS
jgi:hypothetical protein